MAVTLVVCRLGRPEQEDRGADGHHDRRKCDHRSDGQPGDRRADHRSPAHRQHHGVTQLLAGEVTATCLPYSWGVRSSVVMVVILVIRQSERSCFISSRYDRYRSDGMFFETGLVATELV